MFCRNCGKQIEETNNVCPYCGTMVVKRMPTGNSNQYAQIFVEPDENYISSLGNGYLNNFLTAGKIKSCIAFLSDKRIYLRGRMIDTNSSKLQQLNMQKTLDLEDITGTGFIYNDPLWKVALAFLLVIVSVVTFFVSMENYGFFADFFLTLTICSGILAILLFVSYIMTRYTLFFIEYAGGCIKFDATMHGLTEAKNFEKQIRRAKNNVKRKKLICNAANAENVALQNAEERGERGSCFDTNVEKK